MSTLGLVLVGLLIWEEFVTGCGISLQGILQFGAMLLEKLSSGYSGGFFSRLVVQAIWLEYSRQLWHFSFFFTEPGCSRMEPLLLSGVDGLAYNTWIGRSLISLQGIVLSFSYLIHIHPTGCVRGFECFHCFQLQLISLLVRQSTVILYLGIMLIFPEH